MKIKLLINVHLKKTNQKNFTITTQNINPRKPTKPPESKPSWSDIRTQGEVSLVMMTFLCQPPFPLLSLLVHFYC